MIFGLSYIAFFLIMLCAFFAGILGSVLTILLSYAARKKALQKKPSAQGKSLRQESAWQRNAQDEQLFNGR